MTRQPEALQLLLVEDQEANRFLIHAILERTRHSRANHAVVTDAPDLATARAALATQWYDIILLDVQLPDGNGLDLLPDLPPPGQQRPAVVVLSGGVLPVQREAAVLAGCDAFLDKPFLTADLINLLDSFDPVPAHSYRPD